MVTTTPDRASEQFYKMIMRPHKMTNYEQLKRPKTNREEGKRAVFSSSGKDENNFHLNS